MVLLLLYTRGTMSNSQNVVYVIPQRLKYDIINNNPNVQG